MLKGTKTAENLIKALVSECFAHTQYKMFAKAAKDEGEFTIHEIFEEFACNEKEHSEVFYDYLKEEFDREEVSSLNNFTISLSGKTLDNLKTAAGIEHEVWSIDYAAFAKTAKAEGFKEIADIFTKTASVEKHHEEIFNALANKLQKNTLYKSSEPIQWHCTNCGYIAIWSEVPDECPLCKEDREYYEPYVRLY